MPRYSALATAVFSVMPGRAASRAYSNHQNPTARSKREKYFRPGVSRRRQAMRERAPERTAAPLEDRQSAEEMQNSRPSTGALDL